MKNKPALHSMNKSIINLNVLYIFWERILIFHQGNRSILTVRHRFVKKSQTFINDPQTNDHQLLIWSFAGFSVTSYVSDNNLCSYIYK